MDLKLGLVQLCTGDDKADNIRRACAEVRRAAQAGANLVVLPEMFCVPYETARFPAYAEPHGGEAQQALSRIAAETGVWLVGGSVCEVDEAGRYYNTSFVYDACGKEVCRHRKHHLFDIDIKGEQYFKESDILSPGEGATTFESPWGVVGLGICFDVRFPDQAAEMVRRGAHLLIYPASFNMSTGPLHWELLMRARAMDGQCYVAACAPAQNTDASYVSYAHSIVCDPWAGILLDMGTDAGTEVITLDMEKVDEVRRQIPIL